MANIYAPHLPHAFEYLSASVSLCNGFDFHILLSAAAAAAARNPHIRWMAALINRECLPTYRVLVPLTCPRPASQPPQQPVHSFIQFLRHHRQCRCVYLSAAALSSVDWLFLEPTSSSSVVVVRLLMLVLPVKEEITAAER